MTSQSRRPDWYPDPSGKPGRMYWDGEQWHNDIPETPAPVEGTPAESVAEAGRPQRNSVVIAAVCAAIAVLVGTVAVVGYLLAKQPQQPPPTPVAQPAPTAAQPPPPAPPPVSIPGPSYFKTAWGTSCRVAADHVTCQTCAPGQVITNAYTCSDPAPGVAVNGAGVVDHDPRDTGSSSNVQQLAGGQTYHADGWTIVVSGGWVRFVNDATGHGMAVAGQNFDSF